VTGVRRVLFRSSDQPPGEAKVSAHGELRLDLPAGSVTADGLAATIAVQAEPTPGQKVDATLKSSGLKVSTDSLSAQTVDLAARIVEGGRTVDAKLAGPLSGNLESMVFELPALSGSIDVAAPAMPGGEPAM